MRTTQLSGVAATAVLSLAGVFNVPADSPTGPPSMQRPASIDSVPLSPESLAGIWLNDDWDALLLALRTDSTMAFDNGGYLDSDPAVSGTFMLSGSDVVFTAGDSPACAAGDSWTLATTAPEDGRLHTVVTEDGTGNCRVGMGTEWAWTRLSPSSEAGAAITTSGASGGNTYPATQDSLRGIWLLEGSGRLIRFGSDGTYAIDDDGLLGADPDDSGTYQVDGATIAFTSAVSRTCAAGHIHTWTDVVRDDLRLEGNQRFASRLRAEAPETDCASHVWHQQTWIRISA